MILPDCLTEELLQKKLRTFFNDDTIQITKVTSTYAVGKGENYTSDLLRSTVTYTRNNNEEKDSISLILKIQQSGRIMEEFAKAIGLFTTEIEMFSKVLPQMNEIAGSNSISNFAPLSIYTEEVPNPILILQDLTPLGYKLSTRRTGLDLDHCKLAMTKIAQFHAASVIVLEKDPSIKDKFLEGIFRVNSYLTPWIMTGFNAFAKYVPKWPGMEKYAEKLKKLEPSVMSRVVEAGESRLGELNVLNHGDFWVNNMLFKYGPNGKPQDLKSIDFQITKYSSPNLDLQYFFATSCSVEVRETHMHHLLDIYYSHLLAALSLFGYSLDKVPSRKEFIKDFNSRAFYGFIATVAVLPLVKGVKRPDATFDDYMSNDSEEGFRYDCFNNDEYKNYVNILLPYYDSLGILD